jgi:hypothetical protein
MRTMRVLNRLLALARKGCEDGSVLVLALGILRGRLHSVLSETPDRMVFEISGRRAILGVLVTADTTGLGLAFARGAGKEVAGTAIVDLITDVGLEECVDRRPPSSLQRLWMKRISVVRLCERSETYRDASRDHSRHLHRR